MSLDLVDGYEPSVRTQHRRVIAKVDRANSAAAANDATTGQNTQASLV